MENLMVFGVLGVGAIGLFLFIFFQGKKVMVHKEHIFDGGTISFFGFVIGIVVFAYSIRLIVMAVTGLSADFIGETVVTSGVAVLPLVLIGFIGFYKKRWG